MDSSFFIISGTAGAGKNSVMNGLVKKRDDVAIAITTTSREPREGESENNPYHFVSQEQFETMIKNDELLEHEMVYAGHYYGMTKKEIVEIKKSGKHILWQVDYRGHRTLKKKFEEGLIEGKMFSVFIMAPSLESIEERLRKRGDSEAVIQERLKLAQEELNVKDEYEFVVVNEDGKLEEAIAKVSAYIDEKTKAEN